MFCEVSSVGRTMDKDDILKRIREEEDYVRCPKCSNSLAKFLAKNSEGVEDNMISKLLMIPEDKVREIYEEAVKKLREEMAEE